MSGTRGTGSAIKDRRQHALRPWIMDATSAHRDGTVRYDKDGTVLLVRGGPIPGQRSEIAIAADRQYPLIAATYADLNKSLSARANSPRIGDRSLRQLFDAEFERYLDMVDDAQSREAWEPDHGNYVYDADSGRLFLLAPAFWHRLGLVTNAGKLLTDPAGHLCWAQARQRLERPVIGVAGASVGGNVLEGIARELRPLRYKVADPDWVELTNLNRLERASLNWLGGSRGARTDPRDPFEIVRRNKASLTAHAHALVDPYADCFVYEEGLGPDTLEQFLLGDGRDEPRLDVLVEEMDDLRLKVEVREACRNHGIDVLMLSDFGHQIQVQFQPFSHGSDLPLAAGASDDLLHERLDAAMTSGDRRNRLPFMEAMCGQGCAADEFKDWLLGHGEQPTGSLPQSGATALGAGAVAGKLLALHFLGHPVPRTATIDLRHLTITTPPPTSPAW